MIKYKTYIGVLEEDINKIKKMCTDISERDETFGYKIKQAFGVLSIKFKYILIIYSDSQDMANKRGGWFIHKCRDIKVADYFWTKVCKRNKV